MRNKRLGGTTVPINRFGGGWMGGAHGSIEAVRLEQNCTPSGPSSG